MRKALKSSAVAISAILILFTFSSSAIGTEHKEPILLELEEYFALIEEELPAVTTGISRPMRKEEVPASITVITADEIKALGLRHLTDVINYIVPGAVGDIHRSSRTGLYCFRGITSDNNGKYVFMVDGLNCNDLIWWGAFQERYLGLMDDLERIEIIQGTGSILYGSGAVSGIINFITKTGRDFQGMELTSGYGSWDKVETSVKYGKKISDTEDYFYYLAYKHSQGSSPKGGAPQSSPSAARDEHSAPTRYWDHFAPSGKFQANINRGDFSLRMRYVRDQFEEPYTHAPRAGMSTSDSYWFQNYLFIQPELRRELNENNRIKANLAFMMDETGRKRIDAYGSLEDDDKERSGGSRKLRGQFFHYYDGFTSHKLTSGLELFWLHAGRDFKGENIREMSDGVISQRVTPEDLYFAALFFEDIWQLGERTTLFTGLRVEDHNKTEVNFSPRVALSRNYSEKTNYKLLYNCGFRTPDWTYFVENSKKATAETPEPEKIHSFEGHLSHKFNPSLNTSLVGYYTIYKDLINYWYDRVNGVDHGYYNFPEVRAAGLEASGNYRKKNLTVNLSHSFSRPVHLSAGNYSPEARPLTEARADGPVDLSFDRRNWAQFPTHMTKANAIWHINDKCALGVTYFRPWGIFGHRAPDPKLKDASNYLNATLTWKAKDDLEIQLSGYNLLGEDNPWWGYRTGDGVSRSIDPHTEYFLKVIRRF